MAIETSGSLTDIILGVIEIAALLGFLLLFWWFYRMVWRIEADIRAIRDKALPTIEAHLRLISSNTDPDQSRRR